MNNPFQPPSDRSSSWSVWDLAALTGIVLVLVWQAGPVYLVAQERHERVVELRERTREMELLLDESERALEEAIQRREHYRQFVERLESLEHTIDDRLEAVGENP